MTRKILNTVPAAIGAILIGLGAGQAQARSAAGFIRLPNSGTGFHWYCPVSRHHWGLPRLINQTITMGRRWHAAHGGRIACGDISLPNGGYFPPHATHRDGHAEDFEPMTTHHTGGATSVGYSSYSTYWNRKFVQLMYNTGHIAFILHNNSRIRGVRYCYGHANHIHMAIR